MTVTTRALPVVLALFSVVALDACRRSPAPPPAPVEDTAAIRQAREDSIRPATSARAAAAADARRRAAQDSIERARAAAEAARRDSESMRATLTAAITFDFDRSDLRDDARATLDAKLPILLANANVTIRVGGSRRRAGVVRVQPGARPAPRRGGQALPGGARRGRVTRRDDQLRRRAARVHRIERERAGRRTGATSSRSRRAGPCCAPRS